jgi:phage terminase large subunit
VSVQLPEAFDFLFTPSRYKAAHGGRGSAKSHSFASALVIRAWEAPLRVLCSRETQRSIRDSVKRLLDDKIMTHGLSAHYRSTDTEIRGANGSLFIFAGLRNDPDAIKSIEGIDIAWVEEAHRCSARSLEILVPTIRKENSELWFTWNPENETDPVDLMFRGPNGPPPGAVIREVNYDDNPWFPDVLRREMEWDRSRDQDKYLHVWRGGYVTNSEKRVFRNWRIENISDQIGDARPYYGADWGYAVDPSVLIRVYVLGRTLYIEREAYEVGCEIDKTPALFDTIDDGHARAWPITADSARPETISYIQRHGYPHIQSARKGPGSIEDGVEFLKSYDIVVHPECRHTIDELTHYSYKTDRITGETLPKLADKDNNVIDALRYALEGVRMFDGGTVFTTPEEDVVITPRGLPKHWKKVFALDIEQGRMSAVWGAWDQAADVVYLYGEYSAGGDIAVQADAVRSRGSWVPGVFDQSARGRTKDQCERITDRLIDLSLDIFTVDGDTEAAVQEMQGRLSTARLKVFSSLTDWVHQYRAWRRDKDGKLIDDHDGLMRATGLLLLSGLYIATDDMTEEEAQQDWADDTRDSTTGY